MDKSDIEDALKWLKKVGIPASTDDEQSTIYLEIGDFTLELSVDEIHYRADVWRLGNG